MTQPDARTAPSPSRTLARGPGAPRGFGLIEAMISAAILAVGLSGILQLFGHLNDQQTHQRLLVQALHVGEATMEGLLLRYADDPELEEGNHAGPGYGADGLPGGSFFSTEWRVEDGVPITGTRQLTVTVRWTERGVAKTFSLRTVRT
jgi:Tfp pilus assembly protein PilV